MHFYIEIYIIEITSHATPPIILVEQSNNYPSEVIKPMSVVIRRHLIYFFLILLSCFQNKTVSVFETTIRVLGGLLSAHLIASDYATVNTMITFVNLFFAISF